MQEVQFQFPEVTSLLFPEYISSQKPPLPNNMNQEYYTGVVPQLAPYHVVLPATKISAWLSIISFAYIHFGSS